MTTLENRPATALLIIDMQNAVVSDAYEIQRVTKNINALVQSARHSNTPVIWVRHSDAELLEGTPEWEIVPALVPLAAEPIVAKNFGDAFESTNLEEVLAARDVGHLVVAGAESDACIRSTIHGAFTRGYDVTLVGDAHTAGDRREWGAPEPAAVIAHMNLYWQFQNAPGRKAAVKNTRDDLFGTQ